MEYKSRSLTENSNWDSRRRDDHWRADDGIAESRRWDSRRIEDGIAGEYNQEPRQVVQRLAVHYELGEGTRDHSAVKKIIRYYKNGLSNLYSFPKGLHLAQTWWPKWAAWQVTETIATHVNNRQ